MKSGSAETNGSGGASAPRPAGATAPADAQYVWDEEDASLALARLRDLQSAHDAALVVLASARRALANAKRCEEECRCRLGAEIARKLRPQRVFAQPGPARSRRPDQAEQVGQVPAPPKEPQKNEPASRGKPRKPRKPKKPLEELTTGLLSDSQMSWFGALRRTDGHLEVPFEVAAALNNRGLANACGCLECVRDGLRRHRYADPSPALRAAERALPAGEQRQPGEPPGPWVVIDARPGAKALVWRQEYETVEAARLAVEAELGIPDACVLPPGGPPIHREGREVASVEPEL